MLQFPIRATIATVAAMLSYSEHCLFSVSIRRDSRHVFIQLLNSAMHRLLMTVVRLQCFPFRRRQERQVEGFIHRHTHRDIHRDWVDDRNILALKIQVWFLALGKHLTSCFGFLRPSIYQHFRFRRPEIQFPNGGFYETRPRPDISNRLWPESAGILLLRNSVMLYWFRVDMLSSRGRWSAKDWSAQNQHKVLLWSVTLRS